MMIHSKKRAFLMPVVISSTAFALVLFAILGGCGGHVAYPALKGSPPELVVQDMFQATNLGDVETYKEAISSEMRKNLGSDGETKQKLSEAAKLQTADLEVYSVNKVGNKYEVTTNYSIYVLVFEDGGWRVDDLKLTTDAAKEMCQVNQRIVDEAIREYQASSPTGAYPKSLKDLISPDSETLRSMPSCPAGDKPYIWVDGDPPYISCPNEASHTL